MEHTFDFEFYSDRAFNLLTFLVETLQTPWLLGTHCKTNRLKFLVLSGKILRKSDNGISFKTEAGDQFSPITADDFKYFFNLISKHIEPSEDGLIQGKSETRSEIEKFSIPFIDFEIGLAYFKNPKTFRKHFTQSEIDDFIGTPANPMVVSLRLEYSKKIADVQKEAEADYQKIFSERSAAESERRTFLKNLDKAKEIEMNALTKRFDTEKFKVQDEYKQKIKAINEKRYEIEKNSGKKIETLKRELQELEAKIK